MPKQVNWSMADEVDPIYELLHDDKTLARVTMQGPVPVFVVMWRYNVKVGKDGYIELANIARTPDKYRELREHDFIIGVAKDAWRLLLDNDKFLVLNLVVSRVLLMKDKEGRHEEDERGRLVYKISRDVSSVLDWQTKEFGRNAMDVMHDLVDKLNTGEAFED